MNILIEILYKLFIYIIEWVIFITIKNILVKKLFIILDNTISYLVYMFFNNFWLACFEIVEYVDKYRAKKKYWWKSIFDTKFSEKDKIIMTLQIPSWTELNYREMKKIFPKLSKNRIYELIDIKKNIIPRYHEVFFDKKA